MFYSKTTNKIWLEANTERSESNPGRSLGVNMIYKTAVWKTVPHPVENEERRCCQMKKVEFKLPSTAWGFPIASARFFTFHYSLFTIH